MSWSRAAAFVAAVALAVPLAAAAPPPAPLSPASVPAGRYVLDKKHATLIARVNHMGVSLYAMRFDNFDASFDYDPNRPEATRLQASVDTTSLDVNADYGRKFADEFLNASKFPQATFVSTSAAGGGGATGTLTGNLTLMGVTRPVTFNVTLIGSAHEVLPLPVGRRAAGFEATATIKRSDFGSTYLSDLVGDDVTLQIDAEFEKK